MRSLSLALLAPLLTTGLAAPRGFNGLSSALSNSVSWITNPAAVVEQSDVISQWNAEDEMDRSVYDVLRSREEFSSAVKCINNHPDIKKLLEDTSRKITFFAPSNDAFENSPLGKKIPNIGEDRERYIKEMLKYHIVEHELDCRSLGKNSTFATDLRAEDGSFDGAHRRLKVQTTASPPYRITINNYAQVTESDIKARNGIIHKINMPLYLPPDIMDIMYMLPEEFSYTATALLKVDLQDRYEFSKGSKSNHHGEDKRRHRRGRGSAMTTAILPTNEAWQKLPEDLRFFLFSPFGEEALRKLMAWHTIPHKAVYSEWSYGKRSSSSFHRECDMISGKWDRNDRDLSFECDHNYETLTNQKMPVRVKKYKSKVSGSQQYVVELQTHGLYSRRFDNPAQNGVFHAVDQVLCPRKKEGVNENRNQQDWEEWKEWLKEWVQDTNERSH